MAVPGGVFWAGQGMERPDRAVERFLAQAGALRGTPAEEPEEAADPEPEPAPQPADPPPEPEPTRRPEPVPAAEDPAALLAAGRFDEAALAYIGVDDGKQALASLGASLHRAFPVDLPDLPYLIVRSRTGDSFEGFADEQYGVVKITAPSGSSLTFTADALAERIELPRAKALDHLADLVQREGADSVTKGPRLFTLVETAFAIDRPDLVAPILERMLEIDRETGFFISSVRKRVPERSQPDVYRAYRVLQLPDEEEPKEPFIPTPTPTRLGNGPSKRPPPSQRTTVRSEEAIALMREAGPLRKEGDKLYRDTAIKDLKDVEVGEIDRAIGLLDKAAGLYEKALEIEDNDEIAALLRHCSKRMFQLRFWKQQAEAR